MSMHAIPAIEDAVRCTAVTGEACPLGSQCTGGCTPSQPVRPSDEMLLQHLGAAVMLCWAKLPIGARDQILRQADNVIGRAPIRQARNEIVRLMLRHAKVQWSGSRL